LDTQANVTISGNSSLPELSYGSHSITVYANDSLGNMGASESIYFNISEPFPTMFVAAASAASVAVIGVGLVVYFKKRKHYAGSC